MKEILRRDGPLIYLSKNEEESLNMGFGNLENRPMVRLDNGSWYLGQWREGTMIREGRGLFVYPDGSLYEGYWKDNQATFYGRLLHKDGDIY